MRVFAALPLPRGAAAVIDAALEPVRRRSPKLRWVSADALHVTLHFFGELDEPQVGALRGVFEDPGLRRASIPCSLGSLGQFPEKGRPSVLWAGIDRGASEMREFWEMFEARLLPLGFRQDTRGFHPHVTLARVGAALLGPEWSAGAAVPASEFLLEECVLYQSLLERTGARYLPLARIGFGKEAA
jgi:2'-5' RNA ligase